METTRKTPIVPALSRGLTIMRLLGTEGPLAMETVAARLKLPRSSTFRLLETLLALGYAERDASRRYRLVWSLQPNQGHSANLGRRIEAGMKTLAENIGVTIEWYEPSERGLEMRRQQLPSRSEVHVQARPGFVRLWNDELDPVARIGHAFAPGAPAPRPRLKIFKRDGVVSRLTLDETRKLIAKDRKAGGAHDAAFNTNGVRRVAVPLLLPDGQFAGILAAASSISFDPKAPTPARILAALRAACSELSI